MDIFEQHDLFLELNAFDPHWQKHYPTLRAAAEAASCLPEYYNYMQTSEGMLHKLRFTDIPDTVAQNRAERRLRERMMKYMPKHVKLEDWESDEDGE